MSKLCFSFPAGAPPGTRTRGAATPGSYACFSYQADAPLRMPFPCYSYPSMCFSYPDDMPRAGASGAAQPHLPSLRRMPYSSCFRY